MLVPLLKAGVARHAMRGLSILAVEQLARVDYEVANRASELTATVVAFGFQHDMPFLAHVAIRVLQLLDDSGSVLIQLVVALVSNTP